MRFFWIILMLSPLASAETYDLHMHLNGSVSLDFLRARAVKQNAMELFEAFQKLTNQHADIAKKFALIHGMLRSPEDIEDAVVDVARNHPASYLEIRSTPRTFITESFHEYSQAFAVGIARARADQPSKQLFGLLSVDRHAHSLAQAQEILALALQQPLYFVGIDISGYHPHKARTLTGSDLKIFLAEVLATPLGLAIHFGEFNTEAEHLDSLAVLEVLEAWTKTHPGKTLEGKVRFGHVIYTDEAIRERIRKLQVPIEICPDGHRTLGWWSDGEAHPIHHIYPPPHGPVVYGSDDILVFGLDALQDWARFLSLGYEKDAAKYRFGL